MRGSDLLLIVRLDDEEVAGCNAGLVGQGRKQRLIIPRSAIGIEEQVAGRLIIDDTVVSFSRRTRERKSTRIQSSVCQTHEHGIIQLKRVIARTEVTDPVDIACEGDVEDEGIAARPSRQYIVPRSSDELVVATTPIQGVVACTAHQKVVVPPSGDTIVAHPGIEVIGIV